MANFVNPFEKLEYLLWQCKNPPVSSDLKPPLAPVVCFSELVETGLRAVWAEQHAPYTPFLPRPVPAKKELNLLKLESS